MRLDLPWLKLLDRYERKARLLPALLTGFVVGPIAAGLASDTLGWAPSVSIGGGLGAACTVVVLAYAASAAGQYYEKRIWPRWPYDAPTNRWLHPDDDSCAQAQKVLWYSAIERIVGLSIPDVAAQGDPAEIDKVISDAVRALRHRFSHEAAGGLLAIHNEDYGIARNLAGLNSLCWLPVSGVLALIAWTVYLIAGTALIWAVWASTTLVACLVLLRILPWYVCQRADRYTESFFGALTDLYQSSEMKRSTNRDS